MISWMLKWQVYEWVRKASCRKEYQWNYPSLLSPAITWDACSNLNTDEITNGLKKSWSHHTKASWCWCAINGLKLLLCTICYHYAHIHTHLSSGSARVDTNVTLSPSIAKHYGVEIPPTLMEWKQGRMMNGISFTFVVYNILRTRQATTSLLEGTKSLWRWKYRMVDFIIFLTANSNVTLV